MDNRFTLIVLFGQQKRIRGFKQANKEMLTGDSVITLTHTDDLKSQIGFIIEDEALSKKKDTILIEIEEYYPETVDEIIEDIHEFDIKVKFLMVVDADNMTPNDEAVYDRIAEMLDVSDAEVQKSTYMSHDQPVGMFRLPNNVITNITNLNQLIDSARFYYGIQDSSNMAESKIPDTMKDLIESSYNLIASRIVEDIKNIDG